mmetsp:Transcript_3564/g.2155  ORF Transcript_3564/g.2155 Transcript_3564/m.2155 type:complete len:188 (-) Transcript_3564:637-1200(-)
METVNFILSGLGGQGILFMTKVLAQAGLRKGLNILGAETHGMAQRGGSVISHLRFGDVQSSLVKTGSANFLLALEENEAYRNIPFLAKGGKLYANASEDSFPCQQVKSYLEKNKIDYCSMLAGKVAVELDAPMSSNLALIGFFSAFDDGPFSYQELRDTVESVSPDRFKELNLKVFDTCFEIGIKKK